MPTIQLEMGLITGHFITMQGQPQRGRVMFIPSAPALLDEYDDIIVVCHEQVVPLDKHGQMSVSLIATDGAFVNPSQFTYTVIEDFVQGYRSYSIAVPKNTTTDLADVPGGHQRRDPDHPRPQGRSRGGDQGQGLRHYLRQPATQPRPRAMPTSPPATTICGSGTAPAGRTAVR